MVRYAQKIWTLADGSRVYLPGSAIFDMPVMPNELDIFDVDTVQQYPVSTKLELDDSIYRYVEFGEATAAGDMVNSEGPDNTHDNLTPGTDGSVNGVAASLAVGSTVINISDTITLVENEYAGGSLMMETSTGAGYRYKIESHNAPASDALVVIKHGLAVAIGATNELKLVKNPWKEVVQGNVSLAGPAVGASLGVGVDGSFGWVQTRGPAAVLTDGTVVVGQEVVSSDGTAGAVEAMKVAEAAPPTFITPAVGFVMDVGATGEFSLIYLQIE